MHTIQEILKLSADYLKRKEIANPRRQAEELLSDFLGVDRLELYLQFDRPLETKEIDAFRERLKRRAKGEPVLYIHGETEFYGCQIKLTPDVLIPRQETEILADRIAMVLKNSPIEGRSLWDICCGSGCLGISLKKKFPDLNVFLSDISEKALKVAEMNAVLNKVQLEMLKGDLFQPFQGERADYIVCNPPYISEEEWEGLDREVKEFEPKLALVAGPTGLEFYKQIALELHHYLRPKGKLWMEIGYGQGEAVQQIFNHYGWGRFSVGKDWAGHDRFFFLENE